MIKSRGGTAAAAFYQRECKEGIFQGRFVIAEKVAQDHLEKVNVEQYPDIAALHIHGSHLFFPERIAREDTGIGRKALQIMNELQVQLEARYRPFLS